MAESMRGWIERHRDDPAVAAWLKKNPPPAQWQGTPMEWAFTEMPWWAWWW